MQPNTPMPPYGPQQPMAPNPYQNSQMPSMTPPMSAAQLSKGRHPWGLIIALAVTSLLFIAAAGFGVWAFMSRQDYKNNTDKKVADAVTVAKQQEDSAKDKEFIEKEKSPYKTYQGPSTYGDLKITYPKTWAAFVDENGNGDTPIDGYMHPNYVPGFNSGTAYALHLTVSSRNYTQELNQYAGLVKSGKVKVSPYTLPKMPDVLGSRVDGEINQGQQDSMVLLPLRDKTIMVSTQSTEFLKDFNNTILANLTFQP